MLCLVKGFLSVGIKTQRARWQVDCSGEVPTIEQGTLALDRSDFLRYQF